MYPSIAVVIPAYNCAETLAHAVDSALGQTVAPVEVIVVDDGSTDDTALVATRFGTRVRLIRQENGGAALARQTGTQSATADYVAYLDADDWWPQYKLERIAAVLCNVPFDVLLTDLQRGRPDRGAEALLPRNSTFFPYLDRFLTVAARTAEPGLFRLEPESALELLLRGFPVFPSTMVVRRDVIEAVGGWDPRFRRCQDFDIGLRIVRRYPLHYLDEVLAILGLHDANADTDGYVLKQTRGDLQVLHTHLTGEPRHSAYRMAVAEAIARKYCSIARIHRRRGQWEAAAAAYREAARCPGWRAHAWARWAALAPQRLVAGRTQNGSDSQ